MLVASSSLRFALGRTSVRAFTTCEPAQKLKSIFEQYRKENYSREIPSRFKKELLKAATKANPTASSVEIDSLNQILVNIGRPEERLSEEDLTLLLNEAGVHDKRSIPVDKIIQLM